MKFQNISIHGSKVTPCTRKRDERTNERTDKPEAICLIILAKVIERKAMTRLMLSLRMTRRTACSNRDSLA